MNERERMLAQINEATDSAGQIRDRVTRLLAIVEDLPSEIVERIRSVDVGELQRRMDDALYRDVTNDELSELVTLTASPSFQRFLQIEAASRDEVQRIAEEFFMQAVQSC